MKEKLLKIAKKIEKNIGEKFKKVLDVFFVFFFLILGFDFLVLSFFFLFKNKWLIFGLLLSISIFLIFLFVELTYELFDRDE